MKNYGKTVLADFLRVVIIGISTWLIVNFGLGLALDIDQYIILIGGICGITIVTSAVSRAFEKKSGAQETK